MTRHTSTLYAKLLGETARVEWQALQPFFARGALLWVAPTLDLVAVAEAVAQDERAQVAAWLASGEVQSLCASQAQGYVEAEPSLWAVVVSPWVLAQERP
ncbi:DUF2288 domain-containing protein [Pseudomonas typographi]|uniref:DUF2288 domain-containing protein n=1 Tax=Pseudomonas typographi TaxID=2715964 RepID=A0ABR7Z0A1_9PSED|nr:DUF2288 domain-containing protein [Pseudomonas typographi]MBD1598844.1 DUF2288 domain-containing protein [Pseudomonas typographi]